MWWWSSLFIFALGWTGNFALAQDHGDDMYVNPPLYADYPDPDIIRVGNDFYFVSTTFVNSPGLVILHSKDLVNWQTIGYVVDRLEGDPKFDMRGGTAYRSGIFAPSLRYREGTFYVAVTPVGHKTRIYSTKDPGGQWKCNELNVSAFDPGLFFDDDGKAYLFTSGGWDGTVSLKTLSPELDKVVDSRKLFYFQGIEGSKVLKVNGWYYVFNALPRKLALMCSRSKTLDGRWETIQLLDDSKGGHQGAIVDLPNGEWYGFVMHDSGPIGRVTNISPITWKDNWPLWGTADAIGQVPATAPKPIKGQPIVRRPISTDFDRAELPLDWTWNHNPNNSRWSLTERKGFLRLKPTTSPDFWNASNSLTHKGYGPTSCAAAKLDISHLESGDSAGLGMLGKALATLAVERTSEGDVKLNFSTGIDKVKPLESKATTDLGQRSVLHLALMMNFETAKGRCAYSLDGEKWTPIGDAFPLMWDWQTGTFQGQQYAVFCFNPRSSTGYVDVDSIRFIEPALLKE